jgi:biotin transporter BioY
MIGAKAAWVSGVVPFLFGDAVKAALATATLVAWRTIRTGR